LEPAVEWRKVFRMTTLVCSAIVASIFLYALAVEILKSRLGFFAGLARLSPVRPLLFLFYGLAIAAILATRIVNRQLLRGGHRDLFEEKVSRLSRASIITAVLAELPALLGFVFFLLTGSSRDFYFLWFGSLALEFIFFPRSGAWESWLRSSDSKA